ncbi:MAG: hypothetical protein HY674_22105 [Chloroflexi bacterium]|nr:hypothetical protein [Chloroflexota bacterium]
MTSFIPSTETVATAFPPAGQLLKVEGIFTEKSTGHTQPLRRHFMTRQEPAQAGPQKLGQQVRAHWSVEKLQDSLSCKVGLL